MVRETKWIPCIPDPVRFDCRDCVIGLDVACKYRTDETLRFERAARLGKVIGLVAGKEEQALKAVSFIQAVLIRQGLALPAAAIANHLPEQLRNTLTVTQIELILRQTFAVRETSPGMFKWQGDNSTSMTQSYSEDVSTGTAIAKILEEHPHFPQETGRVKFKRLEALRRLQSFETKEVARKTLAESVERLADTVLERERWRFADAASFAINGSLVPPRWKSGSKDQAERREFLAGIYALEIVNDFESITVSYSLLREELLCSNTRLIADMARKYSTGKFLQFADLFQAGYSGLDRALNLFDPYLGYEFSTYATAWIRQAITRSIGNEERLVRLPIHVVESLRKVNTSKEDLYWRLGRTPLPSEVAEETGFAVGRIEELTRVDQPVQRISNQMLEELQDPNDSFDLITSILMEQSVQVMLEKVLTWRERIVIERRFGFGEYEPHTLEEIGEVFGVTRERIRQIQAKALKKIRNQGEDTLLAIMQPDNQ